MVPSQRKPSEAANNSKWYEMSERLIPIVKQTKDVKDVYYKFNLQLWNIRNGLLEWTDEKEIRNAIAGNTCRCTGYMNIFKAVKLAGQNMKGA